MSSNDGKSISWLVAATHSKGNDGGEVVDDKILRIQITSVRSELLPGSCLPFQKVGPSNFLSC